MENKLAVCVLALIGLPGSGKSTFSSYLQECLDSSTGIPFTCVINVCYDKIITLHENVQWSEARKSIEAAVNDMIIKLKRCSDIKAIVKEYNFNMSIRKNPFLEGQRILIVIDDNMYYRSMRYRYYQVARSHKISYCQIYIKCDLQECLRRNCKRDSKESLPQQVIIKMANNLEEPNSSENSWELFSLSVESTKPFTLPLIHSVHNFIKDAFAYPVESFQPETASLLNSTSPKFTHQVDIILRKCIGSIIKAKKKNLSQKQIKDLSTCLTSIKQILFQDIKSGKFLIAEQMVKGVEEGNSETLNSLECLIEKHVNQQITKFSYS